MQFRNADAAILVSRSFSKCKTNEGKNKQVPAARESTEVRVAYHLQKGSGKSRRKVTLNGTRRFPSYHASETFREQRNI